jgi:hypothetical protein
MIAYDPRGMTWDQYCKLMAELFAPNQLGYVEEENWRQWVDGLSGIGYFSESGIPDHRGFEHWHQWAEQVCGILSVTVGEI